LKRKNFTASPIAVEQAGQKNQPPFDGKRLIHDIKNVIWGNERHQLQLSLAPEMPAKL